MGCMNPKDPNDLNGTCKLCGFSEKDPTIPTYLVPRTILAERYVVGRLLSYNGEGAMYMGFDTVTSTKVIIKEFMPDTLCSRPKGKTEVVVNANNAPLYKTYMSEFADLNRSLMKLRGMAHIQGVLDVFYDNNTCYAVLEFVNGISLKSYLANSSGGMLWEQVKELFPPILTTISLIHAAGIIHRGISPMTIFVTDKMELKLGGFAISAARTTNTEIACEIFSGYAAPEQYENGLNGTWTDVYGISAVLYKVMTGANPPEAIARKVNPTPEPMMLNRNVPANVSKAVMGGMRMSGETRIRTITEFVDKLFAPPRYTGSMSGERAVSRKEEARLKKQKQERAKLLAVLALAGAVLVVFIIAFAMTLSGSCASKPPVNTESSSSSSVSSSSRRSSSSRASESIPDAPTSGSGVNTMTETVTVPDLKNYRYETALTTYQGRLTLVPTYVYNDAVSAGLIFEQDIEEGTDVPKDSEIHVKVSKGSSVVALPEYLMQSGSDYTATLDSLNIKYEIRKEPNNEFMEGYVVHCSKEVGDPVDVEHGETIIVYVAEPFTPEPPESSDSESEGPSEAETQNSEE